jgi:hypothetical protein
LIGALFLITPNLLDKTLAFFSDFDIMTVPNTKIVLLPAPASPGAHSAVYSAVTRFSLVWGLFQIVILSLRFIIYSSLGKKAETASNIVFWLGSSYLISTFLNETTTTTVWFVFWAQLIILLGASLVVRAIILAVRI